MKHVDTWTDDFQNVAKKTADDIEQQIVDDMCVEHITRTEPMNLNQSPTYIDGDANIDYEEIHNPDDRLER